MQLTRTHRVLIGLVVAGALVIAGIGFAGSYAAVRELAVQKGFGTFSYFFPIGIDAGICVLLALDLLLTWLRIPFPLLRQTAWVLTAATIAFNGAAAWPDPLGVGMHAVIPMLFVVAVEAARHAVGRIADITADKHMEGVRLTRWLLSPVPTFRLWRRMKLWELRSYEQVIKLEQERMIYQARLQARFGRSWRRKAPVEALMPLRLARYGVPLAETAPAGLAAAGIEPVLLPPRPAEAYEQQAREVSRDRAQGPHPLPQPHAPQELARADAPQVSLAPQVSRAAPAAVDPAAHVTHGSPWFDAQSLLTKTYTGTYDPRRVVEPEPAPAPPRAQAQAPAPQGPEGAASPPERERDEESPEREEEAAYAERDQQVEELRELAHKLSLTYAVEHDRFPEDAELERQVALHYGFQRFPEPDLLQRLIPGIQEEIRKSMAEQRTP